MLTRTDRPFLDREATVAGIDHDWKPNSRWNIRTRLFGSDIRDPANDVTRRRRHGLGRLRDGQGLAPAGDRHVFRRGAARSTTRATCRATTWSTSTTRSAGASPNYRKESRYASKDWRWRVSTSHSATGQRLNNQFRMSRESRLRNGSYEYAQINVNSAGTDDLILRGNGFVNKPPNFNSFFEFDRPRKGNWGFYGESRSVQRRPRRQRATSVTGSRSRPSTSSATRSIVYLALSASRNRRLAGLATRESARQFRSPQRRVERGLQLDHHQPPGTAPQAAGHRPGRAKLRQGYRIDADRQCRRDHRAHR